MFKLLIDAASRWSRSWILWSLFVNVCLICPLAANSQGLIGNEIAISRTQHEQWHRYFQAMTLVEGATVTTAVLTALTVVMQRLRDFRTLSLLKSQLGVCCKNNWYEARGKAIQVFCLLLAPAVIYGCGLFVVFWQTGISTPPFGFRFWND